MDIRILIIEAENRFRKNLYQCLRNKGFTVEKVTPNDDVAAIVARENVDVVLLGVDGLGMEGLALIRPLKAASPATEVIIINDSHHMDLSIEGMDLGAFDDFLIPLDIDSLAKRIREAVGQQD
jgi:DNA-binding NtrC family response regulator